MNRRTNNAGISLIKLFEGLRLNAYLDSVGIPTIGYGHTYRVQLGMSITQDAADLLLAMDLYDSERSVSSLVTAPLTDNQYAALVSFTYNLGAGALERSSLLSKLNGGNVADSADEFLKWTKAGGKELPGLVRRRHAERDLFLKSEITCGAV